MGLDPVCHSHPDPSPLHCAQATNLHPKVMAFAIQTTDGTMGVSAQVLDQEGQQRHLQLENHMAAQESAPMQPHHSPQAFHTLHSHATASHPHASNPSAHGNSSMLTGLSLF